MYWFLEREGGKEKEVEREKKWLLPSGMCPNLGLNPKPKYVPIIGI